MNNIYFIRFEDSDNIGMYRSKQLNSEDHANLCEFLYDESNYKNQSSFLCDTELCANFAKLTDNNPEKSSEIGDYSFGFTNFNQMISWFRNQERFTDFLIMLDLVGKIKFSVYLVNPENTTSSSIQSVTYRYDKYLVISIPPIIVYTFIKNIPDLTNVNIDSILSDLLDFALECL